MLIDGQAWRASALYLWPYKVSYHRIPIIICLFYGFSLITSSNLLCQQLYHRHRTSINVSQWPIQKCLFIFFKIVDPILRVGQTISRKLVPFKSKMICFQLLDWIKSSRKGTTMLKEWTSCTLLRPFPIFPSVSFQLLLLLFFFLFYLSLSLSRSSFFFLFFFCCLPLFSF